MSLKIILKCCCSTEEERCFVSHGFMCSSSSFCRLKDSNKVLQLSFSSEELKVRLSTAWRGKKAFLPYWRLDGMLFSDAKYL